MKLCAYLFLFWCRGWSFSFSLAFSFWPAATYQQKLTYSLLVCHLKSEISGISGCLLPPPGGGGADVKFSTLSSLEMLESLINPVIYIFLHCIMLLCFKCKIKQTWMVSLVKLWRYVKRHGQMDRQTDGQTDGETDLLYQHRTSVCWHAIKMKPVLRAEWVMLREELCILASYCLRSLIRKSSFLEELGVMKLAVIQEEEICCRTLRNAVVNTRWMKGEEE